MDKIEGFEHVMTGLSIGRDHSWAKASALHLIELTSTLRRPGGRMTFSTGLLAIYLRHPFNWAGMCWPPASSLSGWPSTSEFLPSDLRKPAQLWT